MHLAFIASSISRGNSLVSSWCERGMLASLLQAVKAEAIGTAERRSTAPEPGVKKTNAANHVDTKKRGYSPRPSSL